MQSGFWSDESSDVSGYTHLIWAGIQVVPLSYHLYIFNSY